jgi:sortase A
MWVLAVTSVIAIWLLAYAFTLSAVQQHRTNTVLYAQLREELSAGTAPIGGSIDPGSPIAVMAIPRIGLDKEVIVEGTSSGDLIAGPGHRRDTPLPGQAGVSWIYGRSTTFGAPFGRLRALEAGDQITVTTGQAAFTYRVIGVRYPGDPTPSILAPDGSRLLLETAVGDALGTDRTVLVDATLQGKVQPTPPGRPTSLRSAEQPMHGDTGALLPLVFWLQGLVIVLVAAAWARVRWGLWQAWLVATPIVIALLWGAGQSAFMLLPNLL